MRHFDLYGNHMRRVDQLDRQAQQAWHDGDHKRHQALSNQLQRYLANAQRSARYLQ